MMRGMGMTVTNGEGHDGNVQMHSHADVSLRARSEMAAWQAALPDISSARRRTYRRMDRLRRRPDLPKHTRDVGPIRILGRWGRLIAPMERVSQARIRSCEGSQASDLVCRRTHVDLRLECTVQPTTNARTAMARTQDEGHNPSKNAFSVAGSPRILRMTNDPTCRCLSSMSASMLRPDSVSRGILGTLESAMSSGGLQANVAGSNHDGWNLEVRSGHERSHRPSA